MNSSEKKPGNKTLTLKTWLWVGACVVLVVVITVPVWQCINTIHAINQSTENPSITVPATNLLDFLTEEPDDAPLDAAPRTPASPGTQANPPPSAVTQDSTNDGGLPADASKVDVGTESSTFVVTYTDYVTYFFNPPVIDKVEITGIEPFNLFVSANISLVKDIPLTIDNICLTINVYATDATGSQKIPLNVTGNIVIFTMPGSLNQSVPFSQQVALFFPQNTPASRYHLEMSIIDLTVSTVFGDYHIGFSQPDEMYDLGYINYTRPA
jgi:hypothetical protein